jgi:hypothetical protein
LIAGVLPGVTWSAASAAAGTPPPVVDVMSGKAGPALVSPPDSRDESQPLVDVVLNWSPVANTDHYVVEITPNDDWTNNTVVLPAGGTTVGTTYVLPVTLPYGSYFWRVRAEDAAGHHTDWSSERVFYHEWTGAPTITQFATNANPSVSWTPVAEASAYLIQYGPEGNFSPDARVDCFTNHTSYTPYDSIGKEDPSDGACAMDLKTFSGKADTDGDGIHDWSYRVRAVNGTDEATLGADTDPRLTEGCDIKNVTCGPWSPVFSVSYQASPPGAPTTPATLATVNCTITCTDTPTFSWPAVPQARVYQLIISLDSGMLNVQRAFVVAGPQFTPHDSLFDNQAGVSYHWYIVGCNTGTGTVAVTQIDPPTLTVTFTYNGTTYNGPAGKTVAPGLTITSVSATQASFLVGNVATGLIDLGKSVTLGQKCSTGTNGTTFAKRTPPAVLDTPADGAIVTAPAMTFTWKDFLATSGAPLQEAKNYRLQVSPDPKFLSGVFEVVTDFTQFTRPDALFSDGKYYWRVQPVDQSGHNLTWSATRTFVKDSVPPTASLQNNISLVGGATILFSEVVYGVTPANIGVAVAGSGAHVAGTVIIVDGKTARFVPAAPLTAGETYVAWVGPGVVDTVGNAGVADTMPVSAPVVIDSGGTNIKESWSKGLSAKASGGAYISSANTGSSVQLMFSGSSVAIYGRSGPDGGHATIKVDGRTTGSVSFYSKAVTWNKRMTTVSGLSTGRHVLTVVVNGVKDSASKGHAVYVDRFVTGAGTAQENAPLVFQWWSVHRATDAVGASFDSVLGSGAGSRPTGLVYVKGTSVSVIACKGPQSGKVNVVLDGATVASIDLYQSFSSCNKTVYRATLNGGRQSLQLVTTTSRNAASKGNNIDLDAIRVS